MLSIIASIHNAQIFVKKIFLQTFLHKENEKRRKC